MPRIGVGLKADPTAPLSYVVTSIKDRSAIRGSVHVGDRVHLEDASPANRFAYYRGRLGDRFAFVGTTPSGSPTRFVATMAPTGAVSPAFWVYQLMRIALVLVGVDRRRAPAGRRGGARDGRPLLGFGGRDLHRRSLPSGVADRRAVRDDRVLPGVRRVGRGPTRRCLSATQRARTAAVARTDEHAVPRALSRHVVHVARPCSSCSHRSLRCGCKGWASRRRCSTTQPSPPRSLSAGAGGAGADAKRVQWVAWTLAAGFSGPLVGITLLLSKVPVGPWFEWMGATLLAVPFGLGYAIVRHRVVDIGFVVNRALVFGGVSAVVVVAFGVLEWALSNVFVRVSHITSTSLELGARARVGVLAAHDPFQGRSRRRRPLLP